MSPGDVEMQRTASPRLPIATRLAWVGLLVGFAAVAGGCGGAVETNVQGTVAGSSLTGQMALFGSATAGGEILWITVSSEAVECELLRARQCLKGPYLGLNLSRLDEKGNVLPVTPGVYPIYSSLCDTCGPSGPFSAGSFIRRDDACQDQILPEVGHAESGSVIVNGFSLGSGGRLSGSLDVTFASGDRLTGTLGLAYCKQ